VHVAAWKEAYAGIVPDDYLAELTLESREPIWREQLARPASESLMFVAEMGVGDIVGFAHGGPTRWPELPASAELYAIYLLQAYQKLGIGRQLFEHIASDLKEAGHASMICWVLRDGPALGFYEHLQAKPQGEKEIVIGGKPLIEVAMLWERI
jgi:GNAT superfamily N-acetyltransferase